MELGGPVPGKGDTAGTPPRTLPEGAAAGALSHYGHSSSDWSLKRGCPSRAHMYTTAVFF